jgi:alpha-D-xyloside xylohydrolase
VIYNDCYHHRQYINGLVNSGFCGVLFTPEVRGAGSAEEWLRRIQAVCLSPLAQINAWAGRVLPWSFPEVEDGVRAAMKLRMRLIPYLYSAFARYQQEGIPPFRALVLDGSKNPCQRDIRDQYLMGDSILVAPLFAGEAEREVVLPGGPWYDFHTGRLAGEDTAITVSGKQTDIPLFVRDGGIVPMLAEARNHVPNRGEPMELEIRHYGKREGASHLYDDDGESVAHERGEFCWLPLAVRRRADGSLAGSVGPASGRFESAAIVGRWRFMTQREPGGHMGNAE